VNNKLERYGRKWSRTRLGSILRTAETMENLSGQLVSQPRFELDTSQIQIRSGTTEPSCRVFTWYCYSLHTQIKSHGGSLLINKDVDMKLCFLLLYNLQSLNPWCLEKASASSSFFTA
jgi:hypothetical protein